MALRWIAIGCLLQAAAAQCPPPHSALAGAPRAEIQGVIRKVELTPGKGMPQMEIDTGKGIEIVVLGSIRYLMERDFRPKAGTRAVVKGFSQRGLVFARQVEIPAEHVNIVLRNEQGAPLWQGMGWRSDCK